MNITFNKKIISIFIIALIVRSMLLLHVVNHPNTILQPDSKIYISLAQGIIQFNKFCYPETSWKLDTERTPGYPGVIAAILFFKGSLLFVVVFQILLDAFTCVLIYYLGEAFNQGAGFLSGIFAAFNLSMITYAHFILNDSLFLNIFVAALVMIMLFFKKPSLGKSIMIGLLLGLACFIRPVIMYFPPALAVFVLIILFKKYKPFIFKQFLFAFIIILSFVLIIFPWLFRNYKYFGHFQMTSQGGEHLLQYVLPFSWQYSKGLSFIEGMNKAGEEFRKRAHESQFQIENANPFDVSDLKIQLASEYFKKEPLSAIMKAWAFGIGKNIFAPAIIDFSYLFNVKRPHFFYVQGKSVLDRCWRFFTQMQGPFMWILMLNIAVLIISRFIQLWGFFMLLKSNKGYAIHIAGVISYFLLISGPVGYAKYRLPIEPLLIILCAIGFKDLYIRWYKKAIHNDFHKTNN